EVVGVEKGEKIALRRRQRRVAGRTDAWPGLRVDLHVRLVATGDLGAAVARAVVDDDHLAATMRLCQHALDRLGEIPLPVANGARPGPLRTTQADPPPRPPPPRWRRGRGRAAAHSSAPPERTRPAQPAAASCARASAGPSSEPGPAAPEPRIARQGPGELG